ncbi:9085_t:CDS:2 [Ambispora leptoticha]|uniref:9085_t:CDS:1 n=1 Tax=Ambispora leptoticha TaxID=144679 RepID=A0A9N8W9I4_9GLOM|nr:9085_t:CDS:2 [Ambispora leptoticha]
MARSNFHKHDRIVLPVLVEYDEKIRKIMRQYVYDADLILILESENLEIMTEPEAAAIYCLESVNQHQLKIGVHTLLPNARISEITESSGESCGSAYIDEDFKNSLLIKLEKLSFGWWKENITRNFNI